MPKKDIEKNDFYPTVIEMLNGATSSIHFYTISCCFGFYSHGLRTFEEVCLALIGAITRAPRRRFLDIKIITKVDRGNAMDVYAIQRLAALENRFLDKTGDVDTDRIILREMASTGEPVQFLIVDETRIIVSEIQEETYNEELDLVLNKSERGVYFIVEDDKEQFMQYQSLFNEQWEDSHGLNIQVAQISQSKLKHYLESYKGVPRVNNERELHFQILGYLHGKYDPSIVDFEAQKGNTRIDLLVGPRPYHKKSAIELKHKPGDGDINSIIGQIINYREEYEQLTLVVAMPEYSKQRRADLLKELDRLNVSLIEI